jgi:hypothetical protein
MAGPVLAGGGAEALDAAYGGLSDLIVSLDEDQSWKNTRCRGWVVRDLILHLLSDAQRGLVALARPGHQPPDKDAVTYWMDAPGAPDPESRDIRALRSMASQSSLGYLTSTYVETAAAVRALARRMSAEATVSTQGHVLRTDDFLATLVVEAAIHHLDLIVELDDPGPPGSGLVVVRTTLDGLLGRTTPTDWSTAEWALVATGRVAPTDQHRAVLGADIDRLPLLR